MTIRTLRQLAKKFIGRAKPKPKLKLKVPMQKPRPSPPLSFDPNYTASTQFLLQPLEVSKNNDTQSPKPQPKPQSEPPLSPASIMAGFLAKQLPDLPKFTTNPQDLSSKPTSDDGIASLIPKGESVKPIYKPKTATTDEGISPSILPERSNPILSREAQAIRDRAAKLVEGEPEPEENLTNAQIRNQARRLLNNKSAPQRKLQNQAFEQMQGLFDESSVSLLGKRKRETTDVEPVRKKKKTPSTDIKEKAKQIAMFANIKETDENIATITSFTKEMIADKDLSNDVIKNVQQLIDDNPESDFINIMQLMSAGLLKGKTLEHQEQAKDNFEKLNKAIDYRLGITHADYTPKS
ncbi:MAG: hypothetical protein ACJARD_001735 [Alphaproteobacteria bacterium]|jgi:hypothetical protein